MKWPDFLIAGCMKCGTTALRRNLDEHPGIKLLNESNYWFMARTDMDEQGYKSMFTDDKVSGEKCAVYYENEKVMMRIATAMPDCKIILCIRNPVDRLYSEFYMKKRQGHRMGYFSAEGMWGPYFINMLRRGLYYDKFGVIYSLFPRKNIHIVVQEWMAADTIGVTNKVFDFLGVPRIKREVKEIAGDWTDKRKVHVKGYYEQWSRSDYSPMKKKDRKHLLNYYTRSNNKLWELLKFEVKEWKR